MGTYSRLLRGQGHVHVRGTGSLRDSGHPTGTQRAGSGTVIGSRRACDAEGRAIDRYHSRAQMREQSDRGWGYRGTSGPLRVHGEAEETRRCSRPRLTRASSSSGADCPFPQEEAPGVMASLSWGNGERELGKSRAEVRFCLLLQRIACTGPSSPLGLHFPNYIMRASSLS